MRAREVGGSRLLFHDTHHRGVSDPAALRALDLSGYDGVLAFGQSLAEVYRGKGWGRRVFVWHEAADTACSGHLHGARSARASSGSATGATASAPTSCEASCWPAGARRPRARRPRRALSCASAARACAHGARYRGWLANAAVPSAFSRHFATVHVPRRFYATVLPGIPTIRVFEALACGIPLVSAPWQDSEQLFTPGEDFLMAQDGAAMERHLRDVARGSARCARRWPRKGLETILARHSCAHRVDELLGIAATSRRLGWRPDARSRSTDRACFPPIGMAPRPIIGACCPPSRGTATDHLLRAGRVRSAATQRHRAAGLGERRRLSRDHDGVRRRFRGSRRRGRRDQGERRRRVR